MPDGGAGGYEVDTGELAAHAKAVEQVAATLGEALSAAEQVTMGVQAYGMICGPLFVPMVLAVSTPGIVTLGLAKESMGSISAEVAKTAASYDAMDQAHAGSLTGVGEDLR
jgi:hypothetical protein